MQKSPKGGTNLNIHGSEGRMGGGVDEESKIDREILENPPNSICTDDASYMLDCALGLIHN